MIISGDTQLPMRCALACPLESARASANTAVPGMMPKNVVSAKVARPTCSGWLATFLRVRISSTMQSWLDMMHAYSWPKATNEAPVRVESSIKELSL